MLLFCAGYISDLSARMWVFHFLFYLCPPEVNGSNSNTSIWMSFFCRAWMNSRYFSPALYGLQTSDRYWYPTGICSDWVCRCLNILKVTLQGKENKKTIASQSPGAFSSLGSHSHSPVFSFLLPKLCYLHFCLLIVLLNRSDKNYLPLFLVLGFFPPRPFLQTSASSKQ